MSVSENNQFDFVCHYCETKHRLAWRTLKKTGDERRQKTPKFARKSIFPNQKLSKFLRRSSRMLRNHRKLKNYICHHRSYYSEKPLKIWLHPFVF